MSPDKERLENLGRMLSGVAHDINNLLTSIKIQIFLGQMNGSISSEMHYKLEEPVNMIEGIVRNILNYANNKNNSAIKENIDIGASIEATVWIFRYMGSSDASVSTKIDGGIIMGHSASLQNMFLNLLINAGHAVENVEFPEIKIFTKHTEGEAVIKVSDNGCGMTEKTISRLFDPFFTTKDTGNGLGMMMVKECVENHGGRIYVDSTIGKGTVFTIAIPATIQE